MLTHKNLPVISFKSQKEYEKWLSKNHDKPEYHQVPKGVWLRLYKVDSTTPSITKDQMIDTSICWGWIDGLINSYDQDSYLIKVTPRGKKSVWSKINVEKVEKLLKENRMQPSGMYHVELAKKDGRWQAAYEPPSRIRMPSDFLKELRKHPEAYKFYNTLSKSNKFLIASLITTAVREETRQRRVKKFVQMMKDRQKPN